MTHINPTLTMKGARTNLHLSQTEVAKSLGMSTKTYIDYEKYRRVLRTDKAMKFSNLVKQPFDTIIFLPDEYETFVVKSRHGKEVEV